MFELVSEGKNGRRGKLKTMHGTIDTPFFMPVATRATGKFVSSDDYKDIGTRAIISNSLLLSLKPGTKTIMKAGGLHKFMNFSGVIFTDCGGFQSSSTYFEGKTKKGLKFRSPYDGKRILLTPEKIMRIQVEIGSDVAMMLDDMTSPGATREEARIAMENTHRWAKESLEWHKKFREESGSKQLLFGIVQGNFFEDLRKESAEFITSLPFDGFAIGGVAIGETREEMMMAVKTVLPYLPKDKPRYVMGVGSPEDVKELIKLGIDCFDSVFPAMNARHNSLFTDNGIVYIDKGIYAKDYTPIDNNCGCKTCKNYTRAYLHHLTKLKEPNVKRLKTIHNLAYMERMARNVK